MQGNVKDNIHDVASWTLGPSYVICSTLDSVVEVNRSNAAVLCGALDAELQHFGGPEIEGPGAKKI